MNREGTTRYPWLNAIDLEELNRPGRFAPQSVAEVPGDVARLVPPLLRESGDVRLPGRSDAHHPAVPEEASGRRGYACSASRRRRTASCASGAW